MTEATVYLNPEKVNGGIFSCSKPNLIITNDEAQSTVTNTACATELSCSLDNFLSCTTSTSVAESELNFLLTPELTEELKSIRVMPSYDGCI